MTIIDDSDEDSGFEDIFDEPTYPTSEDQQYRHEMRHLIAALRCDEFAAGPFMVS